MFEWWASLPGWARYGVALLALALGGVLLLLTNRFYPWPWAIGAVLLCAATCVNDRWY